VCPERTAIPIRVHIGVIKIIVAAMICSEAWVIFVAREDKRSAAPPPSHQLGSYHLLLLGGLTMFSEKIAKSAYMLLDHEIGNVATVARKNLRLGHSGSRAFLIGIAKKEFTWLDWRARAGCRLHSGSLDDWLREPIAVAEVFMSIVKRRDSFQIKGGQKFNSLALLQIAFMLLATPLSLRDIAREQYDNGMQGWTCQASNPVIRMVGSCNAEDIRTRSHALPELFGKGG
jgi:hypothetical protein